MAKRIKCRENEKRESPRYLLKDEIKPGRKYYLHCCNMNDISGIVWIRMGVWKLLGIRGGGERKAPLMWRKRDRDTANVEMQRNSKTEETFFEK